MRFLFLLFIVVPAVELFLLIQIGRYLGFGATLLLIVVTGIVGASLARGQGLATLAEAQRRVAAGELPGMAMVEGVLILLAGALLITPGVLTDVVGFSLLVPPLRRFLAVSALRRLQARAVDQFSGASGASVHWQWRSGSGPFQHRQPTDVVIDVEPERVTSGGSDELGSSHRPLSGRAGTRDRDPDV